MKKLFFVALFLIASHANSMHSLQKFGRNMRTVSHSARSFSSKPYTSMSMQEKKEALRVLNAKVFEKRALMLGHGAVAAGSAGFSLICAKSATEVFSNTCELDSSMPATSILFSAFFACLPGFFSLASGVISIDQSKEAIDEVRVLKEVMRKRRELTVSIEQAEQK